MWTAANIITEIKDRKSRQMSLVYGDVEREDVGLLIAARKKFGKWQRALEAAHGGIGDDGQAGGEAPHRVQICAAG